MAIIGNSIVAVRPIDTELSSTSENAIANKTVNAAIASVRNEIGTPLVANTAAEMTDTNKIYVYVGSETGYTNGNWYYYDGSHWVSGGVYNSQGFETDKTLMISDAPADAKTVGDKFDETDQNIQDTKDEIEEDIGELSNAIKQLYDFESQIKLDVSYSESNKSINYADGGTANNSTYNPTDYIDISLFETILYKRTGVTGSSNSSGMAFYRADKTYISGVQCALSQAYAGYLPNLYAVEKPENAVYARFTTYKDTVSKGIFEAYGISALAAKFDDIDNDIKQLQAYREEFFPVVIPSVKVALSNGLFVEGTSQDRAITLSIPNGATQIDFLAGYQGADYGYGFVVNGEWVGYHSPATATEILDITLDIPSGATAFKTYWNAVDFETYNKTQHFIVSIKANDDIDFSINKSFAERNSFPIVFDNDFDSIPIISTAYTATSVVQDIYDLYDGLVSDYPTYVEKIDCSDADSELTVTRPAYLSGLPIYLYHFSPNRVIDINSNNDPVQRYNVFVVTGVHPDEKFNIVTTFHMMEAICGSWALNKNLEQVRTLIDFYVIPVLSPWGFVNNSRVNGNGVNINRNFPTYDWYKTATGTNYSGEAPASEYETQLLMYYVNQVKPIVFIDGHTPNMSAEYRDRGTIGVNGVVNGKLATLIARTTSTILSAENQDYPSIDVPLYTIEQKTVQGGATKWVLEQGYGLSLLLEGSRTNRWVNKTFVDTSEQQTETTTLMRENLQFYFNAIVKALGSLLT